MTVPAPIPGADGYHHPSTDAEVAALIAHARSTGKKLRVRGSGHSVAASIHGPGWDVEGKPPPGDVEVLLDRMRSVHIHRDPTDPSRATVEVEAGCHLGRDPYDPTGTSTWANSLNAQLQRAGFALSDLGGITPLLKVAHLAESFNMRMEVHGGGPGNLHVLCAMAFPGETRLNT